MSVCAVIDGKLFCAHGGIPYTTTDLSVVNIPKPLEEPEQSHAAWEILWNDPATEDQLSDIASMTRAGNIEEEQQANAGFIFNFKVSNMHRFDSVS